MTSTHAVLRKRLLERCGLTDADTGGLSPDELRRTQWCPEFDELCRDRMVMGAYRYGLVKHTAGKKDMVAGAIKRLELYRETGNAEHLLDAANACRVEWMQQNHPRFHFRAADDEVHFS